MGRLDRSTIEVDHHSFISQWDDDYTGWDRYSESMIDGLMSCFIIPLFCLFISILCFSEWFLCCSIVLCCCCWRVIHCLCWFPSFAGVPPPFFISLWSRMISDDEWLMYQRVCVSERRAVEWNSRCFWSRILKYDSVVDLVDCLFPLPFTFLTLTAHPCFPSDVFY